MTSQEAIDHVYQRFPFKGYMDGAVDSYLNIAQTVRRHLRQGARVLDFGSGPCDKTAIVQAMGYRCSAIDDLNDDWHLMDDNRDRIMKFARDLSIDFRLGSGGLPFAKATFDMVMMHDIIEHLHDSPRILLNDLLELLKPGGFLFITVPNAVNIRKRVHVLMGKTNLAPFASYYWYQGPWRGHVREYVRSDMELLAKYLGLDIVELRSCHHMLKVLPKWLRSIYVTLTVLFPGCRDSWLFLAKKPDRWVRKNALDAREYAEVKKGISPYKY